MPELILNSLKIHEYRGNDILMDFDRVPLKNFNLLISDNAQGKTRLMNTINFVSKLINGKGRIIQTEFDSEWEFSALQGNKETNVSYRLKIKPDKGKNLYYEEISNNGKNIFSTSKKFLFDEENKRVIGNYYIPENIPAIVSLNDKKFLTIKSIREYFQRIFYISPNKNRDIFVEPGAFIPNTTGTNIASVLETWQNEYPHLFSEVLEELKNNYSFVENISFKEEQLPGFIKTKFLEMKEKGINYSIKQNDWSDGLFRYLFLIMSTKIPFKINENVYSPSLVMIDEVENGLDFKSLKNILTYLNDHSDDLQIIITSHSPIVCEFVSPSYWIIVKRSGNKLNFISPSEVDKELSNNLDLFKHKHWDFYTKHISNSNMYLIK